MTEGNSIRSTVRMTGVAKNTVSKLLVDIGTACACYLHDNVRNVTATRVQCDEIWSFVGMKAKNVPAERAGEPGVWGTCGPGRPSTPSPSCLFPSSWGPGTPNTRPPSWRTWRPGSPNEFS